MIPSLVVMPQEAVGLEVKTPYALLIPPLQAQAHIILILGCVHVLIEEFKLIEGRVTIQAVKNRPEFKKPPDEIRFFFDLLFNFR